MSVIWTIHDGAGDVGEKTSIAGPFAKGITHNRVQHSADGLKITIAFSRRQQDAMRPALGRQVANGAQPGRTGCDGVGIGNGAKRGQAE